MQRQHAAVDHQTVVAVNDPLYGQYQRALKWLQRVFYAQPLIFFDTAVVVQHFHKQVNSSIKLKL